MKLNIIQKSLIKTEKCFENHIHELYVNSIETYSILLGFNRKSEIGKFLLF